VLAAEGLTVRRRTWIAAFLATTAAALVAECWAAWDSSPDTTPWTDLIVTYVPGEVTLAVLGALIAWLPAHFYIRYRRRARRLRGE
jgi:hypothetical protein